MIHIPGIKIIDDILKGLPENARLRSQLGELRALVAQLQTEKESLQTELVEAGAEIQRLRPNRHSQNRLPDESEKMLILIANAPRGITPDLTIRQLGIPKAKGDYFFDQLLKRKFVYTSTGRVNVGWFYHATPEGRDYLAQRELL